MAIFQGKATIAANAKSIREQRLADFAALWDLFQSEASWQYNKTSKTACIMWASAYKMITNNEAAEMYAALGL